MGRLVLRQAVASALETILAEAQSREEALVSAEAEILQMLSSSGEDVERTALLNIVRQEIAKARAPRQ